jgi:hypothetical protein
MTLFPANSCRSPPCVILTAAFFFKLLWPRVWPGAIQDVPVLANSFVAESKMRFGLVTYLWGKDMDLPTLISSCEKSGLGGVEVRTEHKHGVEPSLSKIQRRRFANDLKTAR